MFITPVTKLHTVINIFQNAGHLQNFYIVDPQIGCESKPVLGIPLSECWGINFVTVTIALDNETKGSLLQFYFISTYRLIQKLHASCSFS